MHRFKSAILAKLKNCQNGTFEPVHEIQNFFWPKAFFWSIMKMGIRKNIHNLSQVPPNPGFMQEKVQNGAFLKKDSRELIFFSCFRFLWISRRPGTQNWERVVFCHLKTYAGSVCLYVLLNLLRNHSINIMPALLNWIKLVYGSFGQVKMYCKLDFLPDHPGRNQMYQSS